MLKYFLLDFVDLKYAIYSRLDRSVLWYYFFMILQSDSWPLGLPRNYLAVGMPAAVQVCLISEASRMPLHCQYSSFASGQCLTFVCGHLYR